MSRSTVTCKSVRNSNNKRRASPSISTPRCSRRNCATHDLAGLSKLVPLPFRADEHVPGIEPCAAFEDELAQGWFPLPFHGKGGLKSDASTGQSRAVAYALITHVGHSRSKNRSQAKLTHFTPDLHVSRKALRDQDYTRLKQIFVHLFGKYVLDFADA